MKLKNKKSIFTNLMRLCVIIIALCSILMSGINILQTVNYAEKEKALELSQIAMIVNDMTDKYKDNGYLYQYTINQLSDYADVTIVVTDTYGKVYRISETEAQFPDTIDTDAYDDVLDGHATYRSNAFNRIMKFKTFSVAAPFSVNGTVQGIIFVIAKNEFISPELMVSIHKNLVSLGIAMIVALIASYFISKGLIKPLKKMKESAKEIALGRYDTIECTTKVSEYSDMIEAFNKMSAELEKQDTARSDFIANVSHDLRTPLTTIMGYIRGIMDGAIPVEMQNQYLGVALSEAERMKQMIENNLDLSKYESGNFVPNMSEFNLNEIIRSIVISMEKRIREKNIVIQFKYEKNENIVEGDESAIYRVIQNLLDNALKFAAINSDIEISVTSKENVTYCSIKNYGSSISEEEQKYIWDRYYKADSSRSYHKSGSGLGLFIVKSIINQHNQHITINSDENSVEFVFTLNSK